MLLLGGAKIPPFKRPDLKKHPEQKEITYTEMGIADGPLAYFDLRDYEKDYKFPNLEKDVKAQAEVQKRAYTRERKGRVESGLRGFYFLGTLE